MEKKNLSYRRLCMTPTSHIAAMNGIAASALANCPNTLRTAQP